MVLVYQVVVVLRASRTSPSRRHLFLSQALLLGLLLGSSLGLVHSLEQTAPTCVAIRLGTGLLANSEKGREVTILTGVVRSLHRNTWVMGGHNTNWSIWLLPALPPARLAGHHFNDFLFSCLQN